MIASGKSARTFGNLPGAEAGSADRLGGLSPEARAALTEASQRISRGELGAAEQLLRGILATEPNHTETLRMLAVAYQLGGHTAEAIGVVRHAQRSNPSDALLMNTLGSLLQSAGDVAGAAGSLDMACELSPNNEYDSDLVVALDIVRGDRDGLSRVADGTRHRTFGAAQRAQAHLALGDHAAARALYEEHPIDSRREIGDLINDDWIWRLPHLVNRGHLRVEAGDERGRTELEALLATCEDMAAQGIINTYMQYWVASIHAVLGRRDLALETLDDALERGWRHAWWARHDWNMESLAGDPRYRALLERG